MNFSYCRLFILRRPKYFIQLHHVLVYALVKAEWMKRAQMTHCFDTHHRLLSCHSLERRWLNALGLFICYSVCLSQKCVQKMQFS